MIDAHISDVPFSVARSNGRTGSQLPDFAFDNFEVVPVPEPGSLALVAAATAPVLAARRRRRHADPNAAAK